MGQLVIMMVSIIVFAVLTTMGVSYLSGDIMVRREYKEKGVAAFSGLATAYRAYQRANNTPPSTAAWEAELFPTYMETPRLPTGLVLTYGNNATRGNYFCLTAASTNQARFDALADIAGVFTGGGTGKSAYSGQALRHSACGSDPATAPSFAVGDTIALTLWLD